jgi:flagellar FliL protein
MKWVTKMWVAGTAFLSALPVLASGGGSKMADGVNYIPVTPALVVNYGGPGSRPRYIRMELSIRAETAEDATAVTHHLPLIRDRLISIMSAQTEESIGTPEGKEYVRLYALAEINKALLAVEGHSENHAIYSPSSSMVGTKTSATTSISTAASSTAQDTKPALPSIADIKPVKGPASDLFFNNFVVQK